MFHVAQRCEPFKFTAGFAGAIAGGPIMIRYVDNRDLEKQSGAAVRLKRASRPNRRVQLWRLYCSKSFTALSHRIASMKAST
jgi:hypothetical protein